MGLIAVVGTIFSVTLFSLANSQNIIDVTKFGAVGDGRADDSAAFLKAWSVICGGAGGTMLVSRGKSFLLRHITFQGPCRARSIRVEILGTLVAPKNTNWGKCNGESWITFAEITGLVVDGNGKFNGEGVVWWDKFNSNGLSNCKRPTALRFEKCTNIKINGLTHLDSPRNHITVFGSTGVEISNLHLIAPDLSPNTDGIDLSSSKQVHIHDCIIATGDDCVAINDGCADINITNVACGPGHGISVGSLGDSGGIETVEGVHVKNCSFTRTTNGARIKTMLKGSGYARRITYEQISMVDVKNPIIIDQTYVDKGKSKGKGGKGKDGKSDTKFISKQASGIDVSDVKFSNIRGTCINEDAITLRCTGKGCTNIKMNGISITPSVGGTKLNVICENARGSSAGTNPAVPCLAGGGQRKINQN